MRKWILVHCWLCRWRRPGVALCEVAASRHRGLRLSHHRRGTAVPEMLPALPKQLMARCKLKALERANRSRASTRKCRTNNRQGN